MAATITKQVAKNGSDDAPVFANHAGGAPNVRFRTDDEPVTINTTNPIKNDAANFSFWIHNLLDYSGTFTEITNLRHTQAAISWGTGAKVWRGNRDAGDKGTIVSGAGINYDVATGTVGTTGDAIDHATNGHDFYNGQTVKKTDISAGETDVVVDSRAIIAAGKSKAIVLQAEVSTSTSGGDKADVTNTWKWDEI